MSATNAIIVAWLEQCVKPLGLTGKLTKAYARGDSGST
jgi:hypothetical protein